MLGMASMTTHDTWKATEPVWLDDTTRRYKTEEGTMQMESEQTAELATALAKAQGQMGPAIINKQNPHFKNRYADLAAVMEAVRKPLSDNSLSVTQTTWLREGVLI